MRERVPMVFGGELVHCRALRAVSVCPVDSFQSVTGGLRTLPTPKRLLGRLQDRRSPLTMVAHPQGCPQGLPTPHEVRSGTQCGLCNRSQRRWSWSVQVLNEFNLHQKSVSCATPSDSSGFGIRRLLNRSRCDILP